MSKRIVIGISGASGVIYGIETLKVLRDLNYETHLIVTEAARTNIEIETDYSFDSVVSLASAYHEIQDLTSPLASGSFLNMGIIVAPCSIKSLSAIANSFASNLLVRAADTALKEKRKVALVVRETPLHIGHLKLMARASEMGALIMPPVPAFYIRPKSLDDIVRHTVGKCLDYFQIEHNLFRRWEGRK